MTGVIYLDKNTDFGEVNQEVSSVPYYTYYPQNSGIIFERGTEKTFFYLDFKGETISVIFDIEGDLLLFYLCQKLFYQHHQISAAQFQK